MGIDMSNYKIIYKDIVYSAVSFLPYMTHATVDGEVKIDEVEIIFINQDGELDVIRNKVSAFKFVRR